MSVHKKIIISSRRHRTKPSLKAFQMAFSRWTGSGASPPFNRAAEKITKTSRSEANGRFCSEVFRSSMCETECALWRTQKTRKAISCQSGYIIGAEGARVPVSVSTAVLRDGQEQIIGGALSCR